MTKKQRIEFANKLQKEVNEYWTQAVWPDDIIKIKTKPRNGIYVQREAEEFTALRLPNREIPGLERSLRIIRLDEQSVTIRSLPLDWISHLNGKPFLVQTEWKVKSNSSNKEYTVKLVGTKYTCNCQGFKFRKYCKHSKLIKESNE